MEAREVPRRASTVVGECLCAAEEFLWLVMASFGVKLAILVRFGQFWTSWNSCAHVRPTARTRHLLAACVRPSLVSKSIQLLVGLILTHNLSIGLQANHGHMDKDHPPHLLHCLVLGLPGRSKVV